ncbi:MAG: polyhydroxybutyrate depolymerase [Gemmatimonadaceae bacterium]|nr:polyhydroxybutyrate depolymerase [Gemmatimonadaceae bacterium]
MRPTTLLVLAVLASTLAAPEQAESQGRLRRPRGAAGDEGLRTLQVRGTERSYVVRAPRSATSDATPRAMVIVLHGGGGNAANAEAMSGFTRLVDREGIIVVYPNGSGRPGGRLLTWNAAHCCGFAMENRVDDVGFIDTMIDAIGREFNVDPRRIYVTGMSNGGMMAHRLGRELRHRPAAIAPVVGAVFGDEAMPSSPVSAVIFNGLKDTSVPAAGGLGDGIGRRAWDGVPPRPNAEQGAYWARAAACGATPATRDANGVIHWTWPCGNGVAVELYQVKEGGHAWPGGRAGRRRGDDPGSTLDATDVMWAFFKAHPRTTDD